MAEQNVINENSISKKIESMALKIVDAKSKEMESEIKKHFESQIELIFCSSCPPFSSSRSSSHTSWVPHPVQGPAVQGSAITKSWATRWQTWAESLQQKQQQQQQQQQQLSVTIDKLRDKQHKSSNVDTLKALDTKFEKKIIELENKLDEKCQNFNHLTQENKRIMEVQRSLDPKLATDLSTMRGNIQDVGVKISQSDKKLSDDITRNATTVTKIDNYFKEQIKQQDGEMKGIKESASDQIHDIKQIEKTCSRVEDHVEQLEEQLDAIKKLTKDNAGEILDIGKQTDAFLQNNGTENESISRQLTDFKENINTQIRDQNQHIGDQKQDFDKQKQCLDKRLSELKEVFMTKIINESKDIEQELTQQMNAQKKDLLNDMKGTEDDLNQLEIKIQSLQKIIEKVKHVDLVTLIKVVNLLLQGFQVFMRPSRSSKDPFQTPHTIMHTAKTPQSERSYDSPNKNNSHELVAKCLELLGKLSPVKDISSPKLFT